MHEPSDDRDLELSRVDFLRSILAATMVGVPGVSLAQTGTQERPTRPEITIEDLKSFAKIAGLIFTDAELEQVRKDIATDRAGYEAVRTAADDYSLFPSTIFRVPGADKFPHHRVIVRPSRTNISRPANDEDIAFLTVAELAHLVRNRKISSVELTNLYLNRLKKYGDKLLCVVTLTEELALGQARAADAEMESGKYRGPLHGIPYGIKDLFAVKGYPTQWGTAAFKGQVIDENCAVFDKLTAAGAVCVAKLSLGALAMNDNWFGGRTRNPWSPSQGSSGSSAGSASAMAAGLVAFAIGTETSGSIISPSNRCRVTGLRPTFGSISRYGAMALAWTMDKVGPICRTAEDCALVLAALLGRDERDASSIARPFEYRSPSNLKNWKVGVLGDQKSEAAMLLAELGATISEFTINTNFPGLDAIISVEAAAMFDTITRNGRLNLVTENGWPAIFRTGRFVPAVEYAQAERTRTKLIREFERAFEKCDVVLTSGPGSSMIYNSNLAGYPQILVPFKVDDKGAFSSISFFGKPFSEPKLIAAAHLIQQKTQFYRKRPNLSSL